MVRAAVVAVALALQASAPAASLVRTKLSNVQWDAHSKNPVERAGQGLLKGVHTVRAELCSRRVTAVGDALDKCMEFMTGYCNPGDDMAMDGDPGERTEGEPGDCARFFADHPKAASTTTTTTAAAATPSALVREEPEGAFYDEEDEMLFASCDFEVLDDLVFIFDEPDVDATITGQLAKGDIVSGRDDGVWITLDFDPHAVSISGGSSIGASLLERRGKNGGYCLKQKSGRLQFRPFVTPSVVHHRPHSHASSPQMNDYLRDSNPPDLSHGHRHMDGDRYGESAEAKEPREMPAPNLPRVGAWDLPEATTTTTTPALPKAAAQPQARALTLALAAIIAAVSVSLD